MLDVLQVLLPEVDDRDAFREVVAEQRASRLGEQDLAAVARRADARRADDVEPEIPLFADRRLARVQAHPHAHLLPSRPLVGRERALGGDRPGDGVPCAREGVEERVALGVDLGSTLVAEALAEQLPVVADDVAVGVPELLEQPGRALDVGEEERDGASRKRRHGA